MPKSTSPNRRRSQRSRGERRVSVRGVQRDAPDLRKLGRAMIAFAAAQAEADAQAQAKVKSKAATRTDEPNKGGATE